MQGVSDGRAQGAAVAVFPKLPGTSASALPCADRARAAGTVACKRGGSLQPAARLATTG
jgi:hypothetical protein